MSALHGSCLLPSPVCICKGVEDGLCSAQQAGTLNVSKNPHNFSSNCLRAACGEDKRHVALGESCQITFPRLYCPFSGERFRTRKTETGRFQMHNFSSDARKQLEKRRHFLP